MTFNCRCESRSSLFTVGGIADMMSGELTDESEPLDLRAHHSGSTQSEESALVLERSYYGHLNPSSSLSHLQPFAGGTQHSESNAAYFSWPTLSRWNDAAEDRANYFGTFKRVCCLKLWVDCQHEFALRCVAGAFDEGNNFFYGRRRRCSRSNFPRCGRSRLSSETVAEDAVEGTRSEKPLPV
ncbi:hypothetical protein VIGAN_10125800 [Vigna angularis var. angularis]|uniref:Uncharacterized protein n=2 Tax=Phaseolus angularis TaxID=3914 RepID=A0A0S3T4H9_PHAAN|nr:hypothetical protein VIGAN_10125800 [Vigna angularis var. angularis]